MSVCGGSSFYPKWMQSLLLITLFLYVSDLVSMQTDSEHLGSLVFFNFPQNESMHCFAVASWINLLRLKHTGGFGCLWVWGEGVLGRHGGG